MERSARKGSPRPKTGNNSINVMLRFPRREEHHSQNQEKENPGQSPRPSTSSHQKHRSTEIVSNTEVAVHENRANYLSPTKVESQRFNLDRVFGPEVTQEEVYRHVGKPLLESVQRGFNGTLLAYGQTGSGKTFSMIGPDGGGKVKSGSMADAANKRGLAPRMIEQLFESLPTTLNTPGTSTSTTAGGKLSSPTREGAQFIPARWSVKLSVFELHQSKIVDLLASPAQPTHGHSIRGGSVGGFVVDRLIRQDCHSAQEALAAMAGAHSRRQTHATGSNATSSRSHCITEILLEQEVSGEEVSGDGSSSFIKSKLTLVDLAGAEKAEKTGAVGERREEGNMINKSLLHLGNVIESLTTNQRHIPYRNDNLTFLLQEALGGNSFTTLLCHGRFNADETLSTLQFAEKAKMVQNKQPTINKVVTRQQVEDKNEKLLAKNKSLEEEIKSLKEGVLKSSTRDVASQTSGTDTAGAFRPSSAHLVNSTGSALDAPPQGDCDQEDPTQRSKRRRSPTLVEMSAPQHYTTQTSAENTTLSSASVPTGRLSAIVGSIDDSPDDSRAVAVTGTRDRPSVNITPSGRSVDSDASFPEQYVLEAATSMKDRFPKVPKWLNKFCKQ